MHYAIIAAGRGSRLDSEGAAQPKPLIDIDGRPMIRRLIDIFIDNGAESIAVITNRSMPAVAEYLRAIAPDLPVPLRVISAETPGSMHSFHRLAPLLPRDRRFVLTTVDTIFKPEAFSRYVSDFAADSTADGYMAVTDYIDDEKPLYISIDPATRLIDRFSDTPVAGSPYISAGIYGLSPKALDILRQCAARGITRMRDYQRALLTVGLRLRPYPLGPVIDLDHLTDLAEARKIANS